MKIKFSTKLRTKSSRYDEAFAQAPVLPLILSMALPSVAAQMVNLLYSIVDRIFIGHIPEAGADALAGVGICSTVIILVSAFAQFVGGGGSPLASIALGRGEKENAEKILGQGFSMLLFFTILTMVPIYLFMEPILKLIGASSATMPYAKEYLAIYLIGTFFVMCSTGLNSFINIQGRPRTAMLSVLIGAVTNIVLDPILIFGFGMGVRGAAIATVLSQGLSALFILRVLTAENTSLRIRRDRMKPELATVKHILTLGISPFVMTMTESLIGLFMNHGLAAYGDIYVSVLTIMQSAMMIVGTPLQGFGQGCNPVISYNFGQGNGKRVKEVFRIELIIMFTYNFLLFLLMILWPKAVARIFTSDPLLIEKTGEIMPIFLIGMTIFGLQRACQNTFIALNQAGISVFIALLRKVILLIPLTLLLPHVMGVMGIYSAEAIADGIAAITCTWIFMHRFPKILAGQSDAAEANRNGENYA